jgi:hypothetical protein
MIDDSCVMVIGAAEGCDSSIDIRFSWELMRAREPFTANTPDKAAHRALTHR